jgi:valyl-tRNA synthetase
MSSEASQAPEENEILAKTYDSTEVESHWSVRWQESEIFHPDPTASLTGQKTYVIMMPPPNVTGSLHNGHALFVTLQDILIRYHRMLGENTLWLPGVDHAGIATQAVVERELKRHTNQSRHDLGREAFLAKVWEWKDKNGSRIVEQLKVMGASADWKRERFTMDDQCNRAVKEAFVRMWNDGLIYRGERLINWDPATQTALSNEEVDHEERAGELWQFAYPIKNSDKEIIVATTRPETMLGDTAIAVHPEDERYMDLIGQHVVHPFFPDRVIPIIGDEYVDREFGTGAVKITPAHDPNDFDIGQRHSLPQINIFTYTAEVNENGGPFEGLDRFEARQKVKEAIAEKGLERGTETIQHNVSISQRSSVPIEPMLSRQYFVKAKPLAKLACDAVDGGETRIIPSSWKSTWDHFMHNIRDWCISRQLWWGHRIPVFYDVEKMREAVKEDAARKGIHTSALEALQQQAPLAELLQLALNTIDDDLVRNFSVASIDDLAEKEPDRYVQEEDVLDTWFSSGLWPFSTLGWPDKTKELDAFYPGAVLETGFDILFFWVARMMMMGCYFMGKAPFADVFLHAMVRDANGKKMSKSLGNAIDPLDVINGITRDELLEKTKTYPVPEKLLPKVLAGIKKEYSDGIPASGADGLRFSLAALSGQGRDVKLAIPRIAGYRAFLNKIWNATRFALMRVGPGSVKSIEEVRGDLLLADRYILARLQAVVEKSNQGLNNYRFDETANAIYQFFWTELCDWYIELVKNALSDSAPEAEREAARAVLIHVLDVSMRLLHPLCPFQSEEIWQRLPGRQERWKDTEFCAVAPYPKADEAWKDDAAEADLQTIMRGIVMIRNARQESGLPAQQKVPVSFVSQKSELRALFSAEKANIMRLAMLESLEVHAPDAFTAPRYAAMNADGDMEILIPLEGLIDLDAEADRLSKEISKADKERAGLEKRLSSAQFIDKAPPEVVEKARNQKLDLENKVERLKKALARFADSN